MKAGIVAIVLVVATLVACGTFLRRADDAAKGQCEELLDAGSDK